MLRQYYELVKPRVLYANAFTTVAGYLFAIGIFDSFSLKIFIGTAIGSTFIIASACALNNYYDRDIDRIMTRTINRGVASGAIPGKHAVILSIVLLALGVATLLTLSTLLVLLIGIIGFITYVWLYGVISKRRSIHSTLIGGISGAIPILAGYCAVSNRLDLTALLLFLAMLFWQFPAFYSISIYRREEYKKANIPLMSVKKSVKSTIWQILVYSILTVSSLISLLFVVRLNYLVLLIIIILGMRFINLASEGIKTINAVEWSRSMFKFSLIYMFIFNIALALNGL